jgi:glycosyltransferase involved in cell wall biosynthesis
MVTKLREPGELAYFEHCVRPLLEPGEEMPTEQPLARRLELLRGAWALVNPVRWPEPFGLVMVEALACGTPVVAFPNGAAAEIVEHGWTGFLCRDEQEMVAAVHRVGEIRRAYCRSVAEQRFSMQRMARDHERLYRRLLNCSLPWPRQRPAVHQDRLGA